MAIVPATANVIAKLAQGIADDLLTNAALAATIPIVIAPAMNAAMYMNRGDDREHAHAACARHRIRRARIRLSRPSASTASAGLRKRRRSLRRSRPPSRARSELRGERVVITAGPTREPIDPVRFISNASTGTTGIEMAREALARGAVVDLVLGPTEAPTRPKRAHASRDDRTRDVRRDCSARSGRDDRRRGGRGRRLASRANARAEDQERGERRGRERRAGAQSRYSRRHRPAKERHLPRSALRPRRRPTKRTRARSCGASIWMRLPSTTSRTSADSAPVKTS